MSGTARGSLWRVRVIAMTVSFTALACGAPERATPRPVPRQQSAPTTPHPTGQALAPGARSCGRRR
jgi:hypothetical protein